MARIVVCGTPLVDLDDAGFDQVQAVEPGGDRRAVAQPDGCLSGQFIPP